MTAASFGARAMPDPVQAHGAWVYLFTSIGAGALVGSGHGVEAALLVGTGFAGAFLCTAAFVAGARRKRRRLLTGVALMLVAPLAALWLGAEPAFLVVAGAAIVPAVSAWWIAARLGALSRPALATGIAALVAAAPAAALAGGADVTRALGLFFLLWPFYCWRSLRVARGLRDGRAWDRDELRARGLREAAIVAAWTLASVVALRLS